MPGTPISATYANQVGNQYAGQYHPLAGGGAPAPAGGGFNFGNWLGRPAQRAGAVAAGSDAGAESNLSSVGSTAAFSKRSLGFDGASTGGLLVPLGAH